MKAGRSFAHVPARQGLAVSLHFFEVLLAVFSLILLPKAMLAQANGSAVSLHFWLVANTIFVEATVEGRRGNFILDTGAAALILNSQRFATDTLPGEVGVLDLHGKKMASPEIPIGGVWLAGTFVEVQTALALDLTLLERVKKTAVAGILGAPVFQDFELLFDFANNEIWLLELSKTGCPLATAVRPAPADSLSFNMSSHLPYVEGDFDGKPLRLGIDSGAEVNILDRDVLKNKTLHFTVTGRLNLGGLGSVKEKQPFGHIARFCVGKHEMPDFEAVLTDLSHVNEELEVHLHGILGFTFLRQQKMAVNYRRQKLYFWKAKPAVFSGGVATLPMPELENY